MSAARGVGGDNKLYFLFFPFVPLPAGCGLLSGGLLADHFFSRSNFEKVLCSGFQTDFLFPVFITTAKHIPTVCIHLYVNRSTCFNFNVAPGGASCQLNCCLWNNGSVSWGAMSRLRMFCAMPNVIYTFIHTRIHASIYAEASVQLMLLFQIFATSTSTFPIHLYAHGCRPAYKH